jgi:hypothetical protein
LDNNEFFHWRKDIDFELKSSQKNNTWTLIELPKNRKPITCKWVFKIEYNVDGGVKKYIWTCFVAWGFNQFLALTLKKKSRVIKITSKGIILTLAIQFDLKVHQFDIKTTSLYRVLEKRHIHATYWWTSHFVGPKCHMRVEQINLWIMSTIMSLVSKTRYLFNKSSFYKDKGWFECLHQALWQRLTCYYSCICLHHC